MRSPLPGQRRVYGRRLNRAGAAPSTPPGLFPYDRRSPGGCRTVAGVAAHGVTQATTALEGYAALDRYALDAEASAKLASEIRG